MPRKPAQSKIAYRHLVLPLLALAAAPCLAQDPATNAPALVTKLYPVRPTGAGCTFAEPVDPTEDAWKSFFAGFDVGWPEGSFFREFPQIGRWAVRNSEENHARIAAILRGCGLVPFPVSSIATSLDLKPGDTAALGGGALDEPGRGRRFHVFSVTASLVEMKPDIVSLDAPAP